jgi:hypothetical protein
MDVLLNFVLTIDWQRILLHSNMHFDRHCAFYRPFYFVLHQVLIMSLTHFEFLHDIVSLLIVFKHVAFGISYCIGHS